MRQIQFETSKVFGVFVKLPDGAHRCKLEIDESKRNYILYYIGQQPKQFYLQAHYDTLQGSVSNLTDEQKEGVVDKSKFYNIYLDYVKGAYVEHLSLQKSFASLLTSLNVLLVNPLQDEWDEVCTWGHGSNITYAEYMEVGKNVGKWILLTCNK